MVATVGGRSVDPTSDASLGLGLLVGYELEAAGMGGGGAPTGVAGGDLGSSYPNPTVDGLRGVAINTTAPTIGDVLRFNGSEWVPNENLTRIAGLTGSVDAAGFQAELASLNVPIMQTITAAANASNALEAIATSPNTALGGQIAGARVQTYPPSLLPAAVYNSLNNLIDTDVPLAPLTVVSPDSYLVVLLPSGFVGNNFAARILDSLGNDVTDERVIGVGTNQFQFAAFAGTVTNGARGFYSSTFTSLTAGDQIEVVETSTGTDYTLDERVKIDTASLPAISRPDLDPVVERAIFNRLDVSDVLELLSGILISANEPAPTTPETATNFKAFAVPAATGLTTLPRSQEIVWTSLNDLAPVPGLRYFVQLAENIFTARALLADSSTIALTSVGLFRFGEDESRTLAQVFYFDVPASPTAAQLAGMISIEQFVRPLSEILPGYQFKIKRTNLSDSLAQLINHPNTSGSEPLTIFERDLTRTTRMDVWETVTPNPYSFTLTRLIAALWDENRHEFTDNYFDDLSGANVTIPENAIAYYAPGATNTVWPGQRSFADENIVTITNVSPGVSTPINPLNFNLVVGFQYRFEKGKYPVGAMLQFGNARAIIEFDRDLGLQLVVGRGDGTPVNRTITDSADMINANWGTTAGNNSTEQARGLFTTFGFTFPLTVDITIEKFTGNTSNGSDTHSYIVTDGNTDQTTPTPQTYTFPDVTTLDVNFTYNANVTGLAEFNRNVVNVDTAAPLSDNTVHYVVSMSAPVQRQWTPSNTYDPVSIDQGNFIDANGNFNNDLLNTRTPKFTNDLLLVFSRFDETDQSADPELVVSTLVDGEFERDDPILGFKRLFRTASDLGFSDGQINDLGMKFGQIDTQVAHIQTYYWSGTRRPNHSEILRMWKARIQPGWFGAFRAGNTLTDFFTLRGNLVLDVPAGTVDIGDKLQRLTVERVVLSSSASANTAGQNFVFSTNPVTLLPYNTEDFDEIFVEQVISGTVHTKTVRAAIRDTYEVGTAITIDLNPTSIDFNAAGASHEVIGIRNL